MPGMKIWAGIDQKIKSAWKIKNPPPPSPQRKLKHNTEVKVMSHRKI